MALSFRKHSGPGTLGLDIDGGFLAAVVTTHGHVERAVSSDLPEGLVSDGQVTDSVGLSAAIRDFVTRENLPAAVRLGLSNKQIVVRMMDIPQIEDPKERETAVRFQAAEVIAMPLDDAILDHQVISVGPGPEGRPRMRVVLVAARRTMVEALVETIRAAGLQPQGIDLDAFALVRMLAEASGEEQSARVFCHLAGLSNLAIASGTSCAFTRALSTSWEAENASFALADEIRSSIDYYGTQPEAKPIRQVVLSGPGCQDEALVAALSDQLGVPTEVADPMRGLNGAVLPPGDDPRRYTVAAGLAMGEAA